MRKTEGLVTSPAIARAGRVEKLEVDLDGYAPGDATIETGEAAATADPSHARDAARDSMFLQATLRPLSGANIAPFSVRVRNLSAGGMMADTDVEVEIGDLITVELRNIGEVGGRVVWVRAARFGITFDTPVDPKLARKPMRPEIPQPVISGSGYHRTSHLMG